MEILCKNPKERGMERSIVFYFPLALTVVGTLLYHVAQKTMPRAVSPFALLAVAFATALALCLLSSFRRTRAAALHARLKLVEPGARIFSGHDRSWVPGRLQIGVETESSRLDFQRGRGHPPHPLGNRALPGRGVPTHDGRSGAVHQRTDSARAVAMLH